jgi:ankyrin repeat protein
MSAFPDIDHGHLLGPACARGHIEIVKYLLRTVKEENIALNDIKVAICQACIHGHLNIVKIFLKKSIKLPGWCVIHAVEQGHRDIVQYIISNYHMEKNELLDTLYGILHKACEVGDLEIFQYVFLHFEKIGHRFPRERSYRTLLSLCCMHDGFEMLKFLKEKGFTLEKEKDEALITAIKGNGLKTVKYLIEEKADISQKKDELSWYFSRYGKIETLDYLVENKMVDITYGMLLDSFTRKNEDIVNYLINKGVHKGLGECLELACQNGMFRSVKHIVGLGVEIRQNNDAAFKKAQGHQKIIDYLKKKVLFKAEARTSEKQDN